MKRIVATVLGIAFALTPVITFAAISVGFPFGGPIIANGICDEGEVMVVLDLTGGVPKPLAFLITITTIPFAWYNYLLPEFTLGLASPVPAQCTELSIPIPGAEIFPVIMLGSSLTPGP